MELVSRLLFASIFGWNYSQLELFIQGFRMECLAKTMFSQKSFFGDSRLDLWCFLEASGSGFLIFSALETRLKIECFPGLLVDPGWHQKIKDYRGPW